MSTSPTVSKHSSFVAAIGAALLSACGGSGGGSPNAGLDDATANAYAANATTIASDAASATDSAVLAAQAMIGLTAAASTNEALTSAQSTHVMAATTRPCPGGGSATVSVSGGAPSSLVNGQLDAGEVYAISFDACSGAAGVANLDGTLALTVLTATGDANNGALGLSLTATDLVVTLARGGSTLNGSIARTVSVSTGTDGVARLNVHLTAPSFTLTTNYNARVSAFYLSSVDIQRTVTLVGGTPQSSTYSGTHTLAATLPNGAFSCTVATNGSANYSAAGLPVSGAWTVTLPQTLLGIAIANGLATLTIDNGKDGSIDRTFTLPAPILAAGAG